MSTETPAPSRLVDLRGDSSAEPTPAMRDAMRDAPAGAYGDDDRSIATLQATCAEMFGKDAGLFLPTVTMANLITVMHACSPGQETIVDQDSHIYRNELSGMTRLAGVLPQVVPRDGAVPALAEVTQRFSQPGVHTEDIRLVWTENTHEAAGGAVIDSPTLDALGAIAHKNGARLGIDGARIFNAAEHLHTPVAELTKSADSVAIGLTKTLAVPAGAVLVGDKDLINHGKRLKRMLGGNIKKAGPFAAAALVALDTIVPEIRRDHEIADQISHIVIYSPGLRLEAPVMTNLLRVDTSQIGPAQVCVDILAEHGVLAKAHGPTTMRFATHRSVIPEDVEQVRIAIERLHDSARLRALGRR